MKIVEIAFALLVFNICMAVVTHSGLTSYPYYYESEYVDVYGPDGSLPENISTVSEEQQYSTTMSVFNTIISTVTFDWMYYLIPDELDEPAVPFILGLNAIMLFMLAVAIVELFVKRAELLGSSEVSQ